MRFEQVWTNPHDLKNLISWILLIGFSYLHHFWLVPAFYLERKRVLYLVWILLCLFLILALPNLIDFFNYQPTLSPPPSGIPPKPEFVLEISHFVLLFAVSVLVSITYQTQLRLQRTERQRLQTELAHLKSQIQPHFLFNTLNSIYALAIRQDEKTADTVVQLSEFLRYVIRDAQGDEIALEKELAYLRNYIDLQRSRLRESVEIRFEVEGAPAGIKIVPLILFSFVENAFKHGVSPEEESRIDIRIRIENFRISLLVSNKKVTVRTKESDAGIGVQNARKRLELLYPDRHQLSIRETGTDYTVELLVW